MEKTEIVNRSSGSVPVLLQMSDEVIRSNFWTNRIFENKSEEQLKSRGTWSEKNLNISVKSRVGTGRRS